MKNSLVETLLGAFVILVAAVFLVFSYNTANVGNVSGYSVVADFSGVGGLQAGDDVQISGVKVGSVSAIELQADTYLARVHMDIDPNYELPEDTAALISSKSIMGGLYLALEPGAEDEMLEDGDRIEFTQAPQNLEQLLGQFIFSMQDNGDKGDEEEI